MDMFDALAEPKRRIILEILSDRGELTSSEIADKFNISAPAISQHLKVLREANLVSVEKRAQQRVYTLNNDSFKQLIDWTEKLMKIWGESFEAYEEQIEKTINKDNHKGELKRAERIDIF